MLRGSKLGLILCMLALAGVGSVLALTSAGAQGPDASAKVIEARPAAAAAKPAVMEKRRLPADFDPFAYQPHGDGLAVPLKDGTRAELSLDPALQARVEKILDDYDVPYAALVAIEPDTGRVLAYVSHSSANPDAGDLARDATPPAASVFKIITGAALVDSGLGAGTRACYGGGMSRLTMADITDDPRRDRVCATLADAMGGSINAVFAKLADKQLDAAKLRRYAEAFGFGQRPAFELSAPPSPLEIPSERLELARTAAGFWHVHMSPLQGALVAATIANDGVMLKATLVDRIVDKQDKVLQTTQPQLARKVIGSATARSVGRMMQRTVTDGTSRSAFHEHGKPVLGGIEVAGKTGSLSSERPYRGYSWWVGFAPADKPTIALAALVVNTPKWRIKSSYLAREALREYLVEKPRRARAAAAKTAAAINAPPPAP